MSKPITNMAVTDCLASFSFSILTTGMNPIGVDNRNNETWHTIDGLRIPDSPTVPGLYIHDGKLELIR
jgi:hypothetical protein